MLSRAVGYRYHRLPPKPYSFCKTVVSLYELKQAIKRTKVNKSEQTAKSWCIGVVMELFKWMDRDNKVALPILINSWWMEEVGAATIPARVVSVHKKDDTDVAENF